MENESKMNGKRMENEWKMKGNHPMKQSSYETIIL